MKKFTKYILTLVALAFAAAACVEENLREESPADLGDCYGVYFPSQKVLQETQVFVPEDVLESQILVRRSNANGRIVVPIKVTTEHEDIFSFPEVVFEDGQKEAYFTISFPDAAENPGTTYTLSMTIEDEQYASYYTTHAVSADFACLVEKWTLLTDTVHEAEADKTPATLTDATFLGYWFGYYADPAEVEIYQNDLDPTKFRIMNPFKALCEVEELDASWQYWAEPSDKIDFRVVKIGEVINPGKSGEFIVDRDDFVLFEPFCSFFAHPSYGATWGYPNSSMSSAVWPNDMANDKVLKWQTVKINDEEVQIPAAVQFAPTHYFPGLGGFTNYDGSYGTITIIFPGQNLLDYSVKITPAKSMQDGAVPVDFELGADVAKALYAVFEGNLSATQVEAKVEEMMEDIESLKELTASGTELITCEETGMYTVVALSFAPEGDEPAEGEVEPEDPEVMAVAYASFGFTAGDDDTSVKIKAELVATDRNKGVETESKIPMTAENSLEFFISGTDIKAASMGLYKANHIKYDADFFETVLEDLKDDEELFDAETLDLINGGGYAGYFEDLVPGTEYCLVVYAYNGYTETVECFNATTEGKYLPMADMDINLTDLEPIAAEDFSAEKWAFFAQTSYYNASGSLKLYDSRDMISDVATAEVDPATGIVTVTDMLKSYADTHEFMSDSHDFQYDPSSGYLYYIGGNMNPFYLQADLYTETVGIVSLEATTDYIYQGTFLTLGMVLQSDDYTMIAGKVADGAIAFVQAPGLQGTLDQIFNYYFGETGYSAVGFALETYSYPSFDYYGPMDYLMHPVFVDADKYDLSDYKPNTEKAMSVRKNAATSSYKFNLVETPEGLRASSIEAAKAETKPLNLTYHLSSVKKEADARPADFTSVSVPSAGGRHQLEIREIGGSNLVGARR